MTDLTEALTGWCRTYVAAFNAGDAAAITAHWSFPALTTQAGRSFSFKSAEHFAKNTEILLGFYRAQNVTRVERKLETCVALHENAVSMTVSDIMFTENDTELVSWRAAYVLQRVNGTWKAVMAVADGETEAWAARGTPLGG